MKIDNWTIYKWHGRFSSGDHDASDHTQKGSPSQQAFFYIGDNKNIHFDQSNKNLSSGQYEAF